MATGRVPTTANSPLTAKGDLFTYSTAPARLAVGNSGEQIVADSSTSSGLRWQGSMAAGKNAIINGGMDIWQRGTSIVNTSVGYTADRYYLQSYNAMTVSRQLTGDTTNLPNITYSARVQRDSGATGVNFVYFTQSIESLNSRQFAGKTITFSYYARRGANFSGASNAIGGQLFSGTGTDQNVLSYTGSATVINSISAILTTSWQRFTFTGTVPTNSNELGFYIGYTPVGTAGANDWFEITGIQLELGSVATDFSRAGATIQGELAAAQRYYFRANAASTFPKVISTGGSYYTTTACYAGVPMPTEMRTVPTLTTGTVGSFSVYSAGASRACSAIALGNATPNLVLLNCTTAAATAGNSGWLESTSTTNSFLEFSAEL